MRDVLEDAAERDVDADARDSAADEREITARRSAFLRRDEQKYDASSEARMDAALDRSASKSDRTRRPATACA